MDTPPQEDAFARVRRNRCSDCKLHEPLGDKDITPGSTLDDIAFCNGCWQWVALKPGVAVKDYSDYQAQDQLR
jgi:hypothetical protein